VKAVAYSQLAKQRLLLADKFTQRYPHYWLVWEPGRLVVPRSNVSSTATAPPKGRPAAPSAGDPLCFVLEPNRDGSPTSIGRAEGNDLVLSDESISRQHCTLLHEPTGWQITRCPEASSKVVVQGQALPPGGSAQLAVGAKLELGEVVLTFLSSWGLAQRVSH